MSFLKNFIVVVVLIGIFTRVTNFILCKYVEKKLALYLTPLFVGVVLFPFAALFIGFDVVISEYVMALLAWFLFDLVRKDVKKKS